MLNSFPNLVLLGSALGGLLLGGILGLRRCLLALLAFALASCAALQVFEFLLPWVNGPLALVCALVGWGIGFTSLQFGLDQWSMILRLYRVDGWRINRLFGASLGTSAGVGVACVFLVLFGDPAHVAVLRGGPLAALSQLQGIQQFRQLILARQGSAATQAPSAFGTAREEFLAQLVGDRQVVEQYFRSRETIVERLQSWSTLLHGVTPQPMETALSGLRVDEVLDQPAKFLMLLQGGSDSEQGNAGPRSRVVLRNGRSLEGFVEQQTDEEVSLRVLGGMVMRFHRADVVRIEPVD